MAELDVVSLGEVMIQLNALTPGPLRSVYLFEKRVAGTEANVMVGLARLGYRTGLITRVGDDEFGIAVKNTLRGEGVDVSRVKLDPEGYTGAYFVQVVAVKLGGRGAYARTKREEAQVPAFKVPHVEGVIGAGAVPTKTFIESTEAEKLLR